MTNLTYSKTIMLQSSGCHGLVVKRRDLKFEGCEFKSGCQIPECHFSHLFVVKLYCLFDKTKNNRKRGRSWPM